MSSLTVPNIPVLNAWQDVGKDSVKDALKLRRPTWVSSDHEWYAEIRKCCDDKQPWYFKIRVIKIDNKIWEQIVSCRIDDLYLRGGSRDMAISPDKLEAWTLSKDQSGKPKDSQSETKSHQEL